MLHQRGLVEGLQALEERSRSIRVISFSNGIRSLRERARVVDEDQVPLAVHQEVAGVAVDVRDQVVEDLLPADLLRPLDRVRARRLVDVLDVLAALDPELDGGEVGAHPALHASAAPCRGRAGGRAGRRRSPTCRPPRSPRAGPWAGA